jgi:hypothetical protein
VFTFSCNIMGSCSSQLFLCFCSFSNSCFSIISSCFGFFLYSF